jgi:uncharacterized protein (TIGR00251 family)
MDILDLRQQNERVVFRVRVVPRSSRCAIIGVFEGALKVSLTAAPVEGAANTALVKLLSQLLDVPKSAIAIIRGERSKNKTVRIDGIKSNAVERLLNKAK